jgi:hypothetical protein
MCYLRRHVSNIWVYLTILGCNGAEICTAKMPLKGELEIGGRCFLGSASILFDTAVKETHWIGPEI